MKPRREPRALTIKDFVIALALLVASFFVVFLVVGTGLIGKVPMGLVGVVVVLVVIAYPFVLNWGDITVALRRRQGRCTACGYDRRGIAESAKCPECGSAV